MQRIVSSIFAALALGLVAGLISGAAIGAGIMVVAVGAANLGELILGLVYLSLVGAVYGASEGLWAGAATVAVLPFVRSRSCLHAFVVLVLAGMIAWIAYDFLERGNGWVPQPAYLVPRVINSAIASSVVVWWCGWRTRRGEAKLSCG